MGKTGNDEWFRHPDIVPIRPDPLHRHVGNNADDGVRHAIERNAAPNDIGPSAEAALPEMFRNDRHVGTFFFVRQKSPATNRLDAEDIEVVCRHAKSPELHRKSQPGESRGRGVVSREAVKDRLALAIELETRPGDRPLERFGRFRPGIKSHKATGVFEGKTAQKQVVDQAEDRGVEPYPEHEGDDGKQSETGRFQELAQSKAEVGEHTIRK